MTKMGKGADLSMDHADSTARGVSGGRGARDNFIGWHGGFLFGVVS